MTERPPNQERGGNALASDERPNTYQLLIIRQIGSAILITIILSIATGVFYPLVLGGISQALFPRQANGSLLLSRDGTLIGSRLIGQQFTEARYVHPRPSAAGDKGYNALSSGGSNLGPTNANLVKAVHDRAVTYRQENGLSPNVTIPIDAVTSSGSGLDPHISPANAFLQAGRVASARGLPENEVRTLIEQHIEGRTLGILGEPRVNVLELNLDLDQVR